MSSFHCCALLLWHIFTKWTVNRKSSEMSKLPMKSFLISDEATLVYSAFHTLISALKDNVPWLNGKPTCFPAPSSVLWNPLKWIIKKNLWCGLSTNSAAPQTCLSRLCEAALMTLCMNTYRWTHRHVHNSEHMKPGATEQLQLYYSQYKYLMTSLNSHQLSSILWNVSFYIKCWKRCVHVPSSLMCVKPESTLLIKCRWRPIHAKESLLFFFSLKEKTTWERKCRGGALLHLWWIICSLTLIH